MTARPFAMMAERYVVQLGWAVFPLRPRSKAPLTEHGFEDATRDLERVREWARRWPAANIGAATGCSFDVIDVDGDAGFRTLAEIIAAHGRALDGHPIAVTPGKVKEGAHVGTGAHFYVAVTGFGYQSFGPGLEFKAAGGYVVLPPSVHPDGTGTYSWAVRPRVGAVLPPAPGWVFAHIEAKDAAKLAELAERERKRAARARRPTGEESPMERFNRTATWRELLEPAGWTFSHVHGGREYWVRPGKAGGHSASISDDGDGVLYVFSDEAPPFTPGEAVSKFRAFSMLRHRGDDAEAARTLLAWWRHQEAS